MQQHAIVLQGPAIKMLVLKISPYEGGSVGFSLVPQGYNQHSSQIYTDLVAITKPPIQKLGNTFICHDVINAEVIINYLRTHNFISSDDRAKLAPYLQEINRVTQQRAAFANKVTPTQEEVFLSVAEVYIDDIIEKCSDYDKAVKLLRAAFYEKFLLVSGDIKKLLIDKNIEETVIGSIEALWKICHGKANLESTHLRMNVALPSLMVQRNIIYKKCIEKLKEKFKNLDDEHQLYMVLGLLIFKDEGQGLNPLEDSEKIIRAALTEPVKSTTTKKVFENGMGHLDTLSLVTKAFVVMGILTQSEPNIERIEALQLCFSSPMLKNYLNTLAQQKANMPADEDNQLLRALKTNVSVKVKQALENGEKVEQYFNDGCTPLIFAVKHCSEEVVRTILQFKPEIDKLNKLGYFNALHIAINRPSVAMVKLLLAAGASIFNRCGVRVPTVPNYVPVAKFLPATALMVAIESYAKEKTSERLEVLTLLIKYGAGIGYAYPLEGSIVNLFANAVMIGANRLFVERAQPILTVDQFKANINSNEYLHWQKIFKQVLQCPAFQANDELMKAAQLILEHIEKNIKPVVLMADSPMVAAQSAHEALVRRVEILVADRLDDFQTFLDAIKEKDYSKALRRACTTRDPLALVLIKVLFEYEDRLTIQVNQQAGDQNLAAIHYAAKVGNEEVYHYLENEKHANVNLKDKSQITAVEYLRRYKDATKPKDANYYNALSQKK